MSMYTGIIIMITILIHAQSHNVQVVGILMHVLLILVLLNNNIKYNKKTCIIIIIYI